MAEKIRVLVVDDSAVIRKIMTKILESDPAITVMGTAGDPLIAAQKIAEDVPDVITLDVEMPRMDGITFLQKIMTQHPIPVVICSSLALDGSETTLKALEYGAVEIITKPALGAGKYLEEACVRICDAVKAASQARLKPLCEHHEMVVSPKLTADAVLSKMKTSAGAMLKTTEKVVAVGASTGGTEALRIFLEMMPMDCPGLVIVQHMPEFFTAAFANRLDQLCRITVKEAENGDTVLRGRALIAPGNKHLILKRSGARYFVEIKDGPLVCRHRPSVDVLFRSTAQYAGKNAVGVIMTGMGDDGARGMLEMHESGALTLAQDEESCVVFGMPKEAIKHGAVQTIVPLKQLAAAVLRACQGLERPAAG